MPICSFCGTPEHPTYMPPDMIDPPIEDGPDKGKRKCHFCKFGTDLLIGSDGTKFHKEAVIKDYQEFCESIYKSPGVFKAYHDKMIDTAAKRAMKS